MRLIDADALIEQQFKNDISYNAFCSLVKRQKTISQPSWIPCTERLPEIEFKFSSCNGFYEENGKLQAIDLYSAYESDSVLIVGECKEYSNPMPGIYTAKYYKWAYEDGEECTHWGDNIMGELIFENVVAWMPLPEPYEGGK